MAESRLRDHLDIVASTLEEKGRSDLATIVDMCNNEIHTRKASVTKRTARPSRPVQIKKPAEVMDTVRKVRWAKAELRDVARELRKAGSMAEARTLLKQAADLEEAEMEMTVVEGPVAESTDVLDATDFDVDFDFITDDDDGRGGDDNCEPCPPCEDDDSDDSDEDYDSDEHEEHEEAVESESDDVEIEDEDEEPAKLNTVEACVNEMRSLARELRTSSSKKDRIVAATLLREARTLTADVLAVPSVQPVDLPATDGGSDPVDATDFDFGDEELVDSIVSEDGDVAGDVDSFISDEALDDDTEVELESPEAESEMMGEEPVEEVASETVEDLEKAAAALNRTAAVVRKNGHSAQADQLQARARTFTAKAARMKKASSERREVPASFRRKIASRLGK